MKNDFAAVAARADEAEARNQLVQHLCAMVDDFQRRFDAHVARLAAAEEKRRADEVAAREFEEEPIEEPPGTDDTHVPGGELHDLPAKEEEELLRASGKNSSPSRRRRLVFLFLTEMCPHLTCAIVLI